MSLQIPLGLWILAERTAKQPSAQAMCSGVESLASSQQAPTCWPCEHPGEWHVPASVRPSDGLATVTVAGSLEETSE